MITIDERLIFRALTVIIFQKKHFKNALLRRVGKQQKNVPENELFISVSMRQENNRRTSCVLAVHHK